MTKNSNNLILYIDPFDNSLTPKMLVNYVKTLFYKPNIHKGIRELFNQIFNQVSNYKLNVEYINEAYAVCLKAILQPMKIIKSHHFEAYYVNNESDKLEQSDKSGNEGLGNDKTENENKDKNENNKQSDKAGNETSKLKFGILTENDQTRNLKTYNIPFVSDVFLMYADKVLSILERFKTISDIDTILTISSHYSTLFDDITTPSYSLDSNNLFDNLIFVFNGITGLKYESFEDFILRMEFNDFIKVVDKDQEINYLTYMNTGILQKDKLEFFKKYYSKISVSNSIVGYQEAFKELLRFKEENNISTEFIPTGSCYHQLKSVCINAILDRYKSDYNVLISGVHSSTVNDKIRILNKYKIQTEQIFKANIRRYKTIISNYKHDNDSLFKDSNIEIFRERLTDKYTNKLYFPELGPYFTNGIIEFEILSIGDIIIPPYCPYRFRSFYSNRDFLMCFKCDNNIIYSVAPSEYVIKPKSDDILSFMNVVNNQNANEENSFMFGEFNILSSIKFEFGTIQKQDYRFEFKSK